MNEVFNDRKVNSTSILKYTFLHKCNQEQRPYFGICNTICHQMNHNVTFSRWDQLSRSPSGLTGGSSKMEQKNSAFLEPPIKSGNDSSDDDKMVFLTRLFHEIPLAIFRKIVYPSIYVMTVKWASSSQFHLKRKMR